jgi:hypothetical protein
MININKFKNEVNLLQYILVNDKNITSYEIDNLFEIPEMKNFIVNNVNLILKNKSDIELAIHISNFL